MQLGQHPPAHHVIAHVSDTHLGADDAAVYGDLRPGVQLEAVMARLSEIRPDAIVFTGDIADAGEPGAYETVASIAVPAAEAMGAELVWVMGNHDVREPFARRLLGPDIDGDTPLDQVVEVGGLRIIALDSTIPGYHDGALSADQLGWLRDELSVPAPHGTILALHHPPIPTHMPLVSIIELARQHELAAAIDGSDVRTILAGHYHYSTHSMLGSVPVSVASSTCYVIDPGADPRGLHGNEGPLSFDLVHVHDDRVVHSTVPLTPGRLLLDYPVEALDVVSSMTAEERREAFARVNVDVDSQVLVPRDTLET
jgi:3',5'-cyclic AMP phosphodiesterase CpdA